MQVAYEDRIRDLRSQVDRFASRQMVDQSEIERRIDQLARRQTVLETRQSIVTSISDLGGGPVRAGAASAPAIGPAPHPARPTPMGDSLTLTPPATERQSRLESRAIVASFGLPGEHGPSPRTASLETIERALDRIEHSQHATLQALETRAERRMRRMRTVLGDLGLDPTQVARAGGDGRGTPSGVGGPLIPLPGPDASPFERQVHRTHTILSEAERLARSLSTVPLRKPHSGDLDLSSGFGARLDPFTRTWAMHSGIDFRGATGEPVLSGASGRVIHASSMGGYGLMVEIDHGHGISTRYAHLSRIEVTVGDMVRAGQRVGRVGSTGRSTGPHLHYETRIHGEAVDPMRFVRAGLRLARDD
jgi:murein DD-endopeptidase MepM/ murein hydrolase activator NlpD